MGLGGATQGLPTHVEYWNVKVHEIASRSSMARNGDGSDGCEGLLGSGMLCVGEPCSACSIKTMHIQFIDLYKNNDMEVH